MSAIGKFLHYIVYTAFYTPDISVKLVESCSKYNATKFTVQRRRLLNFKIYVSHNDRFLKNSLLNKEILKNK